MILSQAAIVLGMLIYLSGEDLLGLDSVEKNKAIGIT
jgi:hypothetical protein